MKNNTSLYLIGISFVSTIGGFLFGYDTAIISGCNTFLETHFELSPAMLGWLLSSALLGTILGCVISGAITDKYGRKKALILAAILLTISAFRSMLPPQFLGNPDHTFGASKQHIKNKCYHVQHVNPLDNLYKRLIKPFYGIVTKYLPQYLNWFIFLEKMKK